MDKSKCWPLQHYADMMDKCGVWPIARNMHKNGLDISLALRALRMTDKYTQRGRMTD